MTAPRIASQASPRVVECSRRTVAKGAVSKPQSSVQLLAALEALPEPARRAHERALDRFTNACGCAEGAVGALTLAALVLGRFLLTFSHWSLLEIAGLAGRAVLALVVGGFAGKLLGLAIARARFRALCHRITRGTIDHTPFDHSSIPATVERVFGLASLTARDAAASDVLHLLQLPTPRGDAPLTLSEPADSGFVCVPAAQAAAAAGAPALQQAMAASAVPHTLQGFLHVAFRKRLDMIPAEDKAARELLIRRFMAIRNELDAREFIHETRMRIRERRPLRRPVETIREGDRK